MPISTPKSLLSIYRDDSDHFIHVLDHLFIPAIEKAGLKPIRPKVEGAEVIQAQIIKNIEQSEMVLCDMSALNPNVFFELGIRTAVDKPACMVVDDITTNVPFDTSILNYHKYKSCLDPWVLENEIDTLCSHILATIEAGERNALWRYFGLSARAEFSENETGIEAKVDLMSLRLDGLARQLSGEDQSAKRQRHELEEDPTYSLYQRLSDLVEMTGATVNKGSGHNNELEMHIKGELPEHVEVEMQKLANEVDHKLIIKKSPASKK